MLFSDIEGSTALLSRLGGKYGDVLDIHRRVLRAAWVNHGGAEMGTEGDSFFVVFESAADGVRAALEAQRGMAVQDWPRGVSSPVDSVRPRGGFDGRRLASARMRWRPARFPWPRKRRSASR